MGRLGDASRASRAFDPSRGEAALLALCIGLFSLAPAVASDSEPCAAADARTLAFARVSPLRVTRSPERDSPERLQMRFGNAYPVVRTTNDAVGLCLDGVVRWARRSHVFEIGSPDWVVATGGTGPRPRVRFWRGQERLGAHLARDTTATAAPDYEELIASMTDTPMRFPVYNRDLLQMTYDERQVAVASVLVPFRAEMITAYRLIHLAAAADVVVVLDASGSTKGFLSALLRALSNAAGAPPATRVLVVAVDGRGTLSAVDLVPLSELGPRRWHAPDEAVTVPAGTDGAGSGYGFRKAAEQLPAQARALPLVLLAGGDIALDARAWRGYPSKHVVQITPELDETLARSTRTLGANATFHPFSTDTSAVAASVLKGMLPAGDAPEERQLTRADFDALAVIAERSGMMAVLPQDPRETPQLVAVPAFADDGADWFSVPLWVVVDGLLLRFQEQGGP